MEYYFQKVFYIFVNFLKKSKFKFFFNLLKFFLFFQKKQMIDMPNTNIQLDTITFRYYSDRSQPHHTKTCGNNCHHNSSLFRITLLH